MRLGKLYLLLAALPVLHVIVSGCGAHTRQISRISNQETSSGVSRHLIGTMSFNVWDDFVVSEAGVKQGLDGSCRFVEPSLNDESTRWKPFQVYWVIFGDSSEVRNGRTLTGFFGSQDRVDSNLITNLSGETAVGFSYVNPAMYRVIDISPGISGAEGATLETTLNVMGRKAVVRSKTFVSNGRCEVSSEVCNGSVDCSAPGMFVKLGNFRVTQTLLGIPKDVSIDPEPQLRWH